MNAIRDQTETFGLTEIAIERTSCFGACPVYTALLRADGSVSYEGYADVPRIGTHTGSVGAHAFVYLAQLAQDLHIDGLDDLYTGTVTDSPTVFLSLLSPRGRKTIMHYAPSSTGPPRLTAFENEVDRIVEKADWR